MSDVAEVKEALERFEVATSETIEGITGIFVAPATLDDGLAVVDAARRWVRMVSEFPTGEDVQRTVASMPRWMLEAIREHVGVPEDVVSVILVAAVGVEKDSE